MKKLFIVLSTLLLSISAQAATVTFINHYYENAKTDPNPSLTIEMGLGSQYIPQLNSGILASGQATTPATIIAAKGTKNECKDFPGSYDPPTFIKVYVTQDPQKFGLFAIGVGCAAKNVYNNNARISSFLGGEGLSFSWNRGQNLRITFCNSRDYFYGCH